MHFLLWLPTAKPSEGRLLPQILFPSPLPAQIEEEPGQGKAEQDVSQPIQGDSFAHVLSRVTLSTGGRFQNANYFFLFTITDCRELKLDANQSLSSNNPVDFYFQFLW